MKLKIRKNYPGNPGIVKEQMTESIIHHTNIIDESFRTEEVSGYDLYVYFNHEEFTFAVAERERKKFIVLQSWLIDSTQSDLLELLDVVWKESEILRTKGYKKVICCSGFRYSTLVPNPLYEPMSAEDQLRFSNTLDSDDEIISDEIRQAEARNIFAIPYPVFRVISGWFPAAEFHHTTTALIENVLTSNRNSISNLMLVNVHSTYLDILVSKGRQLMFCNSFDYNNQESLVYYILYTCEQLHLNPDSIELHFAGEVNSSSPFYQMIAKYVRNIEFVNRPDNYTYSYAFDSIPASSHFNILSQIFCA